MSVQHPAPMVLLIGTVSLGLYGCKSCIGDLPSDNPDDPTDTAKEDTAEEDTAEEDTGPAPPCAVPEVEPNNTLGAAQDLPLEEWACGVLTTKGDFDYFRFTTEKAGWVKVWVRGQDIGSSSDLQLALTDPADDYSFVSTTSPDSLDPLVLFYADRPGTFYVNVADQYYGYGDDYIWEMIASAAKEPLVWSDEELEPNDILADATPVVSGDTYFGIVSSGSDNDWFTLSLPEGESTITARILAWEYGSPLLSRLRLYDPSTEKVLDISQGNDVSEADVMLTHKTSTSGPWGLLVTSRTNSGGSGAYWYVLEITVETIPLAE